MTPKQQLIHKYLHYQSIGKSIFTVTLSTYIKEQPFPPTHMFSRMWDNYFITKVKKRLPYKEPLDHDYVIELSPPTLDSKGSYTSYYGYHGFIALNSSYEYRIWSNGHLNKHLCGALKSFRRKGLYRPFRINSYLIEPVKNIESWIEYLHKTHNPIHSFV